MATAARTLIDERLSELEKTTELGRAEAWQRDVVWGTLDRLDRDGRESVSRESVHGLIRQAISRTGKKKNGRSI